MSEEQGQNLEETWQDYVNTIYGGEEQLDADQLHELKHAFYAGGTGMYRMFRNASTSVPNIVDFVRKTEADINAWVDNLKAGIPDNS